MALRRFQSLVSRFDFASGFNQNENSRGCFQYPEALEAAYPVCNTPLNQLAKATQDALVFLTLTLTLHSAIRVAFQTKPVVMTGLDGLATIIPEML
ncbi:MAG: hypothetical protein ACE5NG_04525, partial [bacterium]